MLTTYTIANADVSISKISNVDWIIELLKNAASVPTPSDEEERGRAIERRRPELSPRSQQELRQGRGAITLFGVHHRAALQCLRAYSNTPFQTPQNLLWSYASLPTLPWRQSLPRIPCSVEELVQK